MEVLSLFSNKKTKYHYSYIAIGDFIHYISGIIAVLSGPD